MATALCPGSFDPVTNGHVDIIERTSRHFDDVIVAVTRNPQKSQSRFDLEERQEMLGEALRHLDNVRIESLKGLVVDFARDHGAAIIVKGLRAVSDFDYELQMAQMNQSLSGIDTFFISTSPRVLVPLLEPRVRGGEVRRRRVQHGPPGGVGAAGGTVRRGSEAAMGDEQAYDLETLLLQLREIIDTARTMPMSASVLVNREETLELVDDALHSLPEELRHARWLLKERDEYLAQARRDAEDIVEAARVQAERMVERTEVAREARRVAQQVVAHAEADSRRLRHEAEDYIDQKLASFEVVLERTMQTVQRGREQLQAVVGPMPPDPAVETLARHRRIRRFSTRTTSNGRTGHRAAQLVRLLSSHPAPGLSGRQPRGPLPLAARAGASRPTFTKSPDETMSDLRIDVADLLTHPGSRRPLHLEASVEGLGGRAARVEEPVQLDLVLERVPDGIVARGMVRAHWAGRLQRLPPGDLLRPRRRRRRGALRAPSRRRRDLPARRSRDRPRAAGPRRRPARAAARTHVRLHRRTTLRRPRPQRRRRRRPPSDPRWAALSELEL